jgi:RHS repeat-associated protein
VPSDNNTYGYTPLNQLSTVNSGSYGYDSADNLTKLVSGTPQTYDVANEITSSGTSTYATITLVSSAAVGDKTGAGSTLVPTLSTSAQANDQMVVATTFAGSTHSVSTPSGYTVVGSVTSSGSNPATTVVFRHTAAAGDKSVTLQFNGSFPKTAVIANYRGVDPTTPVDVSSSGSTNAGTSVTAPSVTTTVAADRLLLFEGATGHSSAASFTPPTGMTAVNAKDTYPQIATALADQALTVAGATGSRTATFGTTAQLDGFLLALRPVITGGGTTTYGYDLRGNRTSLTPPSGPQTTYGYDQANRLTAYGSTATYSYNGDGLRMSKTVSGVAEPFVWDLSQGLPLPIKDGGTSFIYGPGGLPVEQISSSGTVFYFHHDQLGSTRVLTDSSGAVQATFTYDAYGNTTGKTGTATTALQYAGQYVDAESGLEYLRARYYDPATGQFLSRDPIVSMTRSPYAYVHDNPLNALDPAGLWSLNPLDDIQQAAGDVAGAAKTVTDNVARGAETVVTYSYDHSAGIAAGCSLFAWVPVAGEVAAGCALGFGALTAAKGVAHGDLAETFDGVFSTIPGYGALAGWSGRQLRLAYILELAAWSAFETGPHANGNGGPPPPTPDLLTSSASLLNGC